MRSDYKTRYQTYSKTRSTKRHRIIFLSLVVLTTVLLICYFKYPFKFKATVENDETYYYQEKSIQLDSPPISAKSTQLDAPPIGSNLKTDLSFEDNMALAEQALDSLTDAPTRLTKQVKVGDSLARLFNEAGLSNQQLYHLIKTAEHKKELEKLLPGEIVHLTISPECELLSLSKSLSPIKTLEVALHDNGKYKSRIQEKKVEKQLAFGTGIINDSFYNAAKKATLDDNIIMQLTDIFAHDIDYSLDINANDSFKVLYEKNYVEGQFIGMGHILRAEFNVKGKHYVAVRYTNSQGKTNYYSPTGESLQKGFLRNPVEFTRISSHFNLERKHPVLHKIRAHRGVDYAAPTGTPVRAVGNAKIAFIGRKGGYGNTIELQHGPKYSTLYGHLSRFAANLKPGQSVKQGQVIGYVGASGLATGPHLHYEFRINGVHQDPLKVALPRGISEPIKDEKFFNHVKETEALLVEQENIMLAFASNA